MGHMTVKINTANSNNIILKPDRQCVCITCHFCVMLGFLGYPNSLTAIHFKRALLLSYLPATKKHT